MFLYHYALNANKSVSSNNEEHNIHDIKRCLPSVSLAHATSILQICPDVVGKSYLQKLLNPAIFVFKKNGIL